MYSGSHFLRLRVRVRACPWYFAVQGPLKRVSVRVRGRVRVRN